MRNYLTGQENYNTLGVIMETKGRSLPIYPENKFQGYDVGDLMAETNRLRGLITKRGTLEILIPLCCSTTPVRYKQFRDSIKGISSKTLASRLRDLEKNGVLERHAYNEIPPRVEYTLTRKGQELITSMINLLHWMKKWSKK